MRIIAGSRKGHTIFAPRGLDTRPTSDRVREAAFNLIGPVDGAAVLDLFAGSGAMGLEALSRGARFALFVDAGAQARGIIRENVERLRVGGSARLFRRDATRMGPIGPMPPFSLADDPDYPLRLIVDCPEHVANWRPLVQWLLAIPYLWIAGVLYWLTGALTIVAFFTVLFTKEIPRGLFELMVPGLRWNFRGNAYAYFATDRYPPFVWG